MKKIIVSLLLIGFSKINVGQNVGINSTGVAPNVSAMLDIVAADKGLLVPRVALTSTTDAATILTPATSLLVYNTATAGVSPNNVVPGYYYNSGTTVAPVWIRLATGNGASWLLLGNAGTSAVTNFLGTTDNVDLVFRTNNTEKVRIQSGGNVLIGTAISSAKVNIVGTSASTMYISGPGGSGFGTSGVIDIFDNQAVPLRNLTLGYSAGPPYYGMVNSFGSSSAAEERMGEFDFSNRTLSPADARIATIAGVTRPGVTNSGSLKFITRNAGTFVSNALWINYDGKVAVGNRAPVSKFDVEGGVSIGTTYAGGTASPVNGMIVEGNVGLGVAVPAYNVEMNGTFGFGNGTAGVYRSRTETRNDAGLIASQSGFYETSAPVNFPTGASSWWHLIDVRHSNNANNYALQISGSFFDQDLYFRKTNNSAVQPWSQFLTTTAGSSNAWLITGNTGTNPAINFIGTTNAVDWVMRTNNTERARITAGGLVGIGTTIPQVSLAVNGAGTNVYATDAWIENNMHVQGNEVLTVGGRGRMRVGTAWGYVGLYSDASSGGLGNDLVLGASSGTTRVGCNGCTTQNLLVNGALTVYPTSSTFNRIISGGAGSYLGVYTDALYNGTATTPTFLYDGMTLSSVGTTFGDVSYSSENSGGWHYWMIGGNRRMRLDQFSALMLNAGSFNTFGADVAENFTHDGSLEEGDVVMIDDEGDNEIKLCDRAKSSKVFGVISTTPGVILNSIDSDEFDKACVANKPKTAQEREQRWIEYKEEYKKKHLPVALNGRTPCKVITSNSPIKKGDFITSSSKAGYGEKLVGPGSYFGIALENDNGSGKIMIAVKSGYTNE